MGAVVNWAGAWAMPATPAIRATASSLRRFASLSRMRTSAAAPSEMELELAGVTVPPSRKAGLSLGILVGSAVKGCSSRATSVVPARDFTGTDTISLANEPSSLAVFDRLRLSIAKASCASRVNW